MRLQKTIKDFLISKTLIFSFPLVCSAQQSQQVIFDSTKAYHYEAVFIDNKGDTPTKEKIILQSLGVPWEAQSSQIKCKMFYFSTDSIVENMIDPKSKKRKPVYIRPSTSVTEGVTEDSAAIWIHPFRKNQYAYTEVCAFPRIELNRLSEGEKWGGSTLYILFGWERFKGKVSETYTVEKKMRYNFNSSDLEDCWQILGVGVHNKLGTSSVRYIFNREIGFIEMNYEFFDGTKILFKLVNIERV